MRAIHPAGLAAAVLAAVTVTVSAAPGDAVPPQDHRLQPTTVSCHTTASACDDAQRWFDATGVPWRQLGLQLEMYGEPIANADGKFAHGLVDLDTRRLRIQLRGSIATTRTFTHEIGHVVWSALDDELHATYAYTRELPNGTPRRGHHDAGYDSVIEDHAEVFVAWRTGGPPRSPFTAPHETDFVELEPWLWPDNFPPLNERQKARFHRPTGSSMTERMP